MWPQKMAQVVWPMMIVTVTNLRASIGSNSEILKEMWIFWAKISQIAKMPKSTYLQIFQNCCLVKPSKFVGVTIIRGHTT